MERSGKKTGIRSVLCVCVFSSYLLVVESVRSKSNNIIRMNGTKKKKKKKRKKIKCGISKISTFIVILPCFDLRDCFVSRLIALSSLLCFHVILGRRFIFVLAQSLACVYVFLFQSLKEKWMKAIRSMIIKFTSQ